jgi:hypothetical protein
MSSSSDTKKIFGEILHFLPLKQLEFIFTGSEVILFLYRFCSLVILCIYVLGCDAV